jgi:hypothetical protein
MIFSLAVFLVLQSIAATEISLRPAGLKNADPGKYSRFNNGI